MLKRLLLSTSIYVANAISLGSCPDGWVYSSGICYILPTKEDEAGKPQPIKLNWNDAEAHCKSIGAHLSSVSDLVENTIVAALCANGKNVEDENSDHKCWIGLHDQDQKGRFEWSDGSAFEYQNWSYEHSLSGLTNQDALNSADHHDSNRVFLPEAECNRNDSSCAADCGYISATDLTFGEWICGHKMAFICQMPFDEFAGSILFRISSLKVGDNSRLNIHQLDLFTDEKCKDQIDLSDASKVTLSTAITSKFLKTYSNSDIDDTDTTSTLGLNQLTEGPQPENQNTNNNAIDWSPLYDHDPATFVTVACGEDVVCVPTLYILFKEPTTIMCMKFHINSNGEEQLRSDDPEAVSQEMFTFSRKTYTGWQTMPVILNDLVNSRDPNIASYRDYAWSVPYLPNFLSVRAVVNDTLSVAIPIKNATPKGIDRMRKYAKIKFILPTARQYSLGGNFSRVFNNACGLSTQSSVFIQPAKSTETGQQLMNDNTGNARQTVHSMIPNHILRPYSEAEYIHRSFSSEDEKLHMLEWNLRALEPGQYRICVCIAGPSSPVSLCDTSSHSWSSVGNLFIEGASSFRNPEIITYSGGLFSVQMHGFGLTPSTSHVSQSRIRFLQGDYFNKDRCDFSDQSKATSGDEGTFYGDSDYSFSPRFTNEHDNFNLKFTSCKLNLKDCLMRPPHTTSRTFQKWNDVSLVTSKPDVYTVCHCHENCLNNSASRHFYNDRPAVWIPAFRVYVGVKLSKCPTDITCHNGGHCVMTSDETVRCVCRSGFTGETCSTHRAISMIDEEGRVRLMDAETISNVTDKKQQIFESKLLDRNLMAKLQTDEGSRNQLIEALTGKLTQDEVIKRLHSSEFLSLNHNNNKLRNSPSGGATASNNDFTNERIIHISTLRFPKVNFTQIIKRYGRGGVENKLAQQCDDRLKASTVYYQSITNSDMDKNIDSKAVELLRTSFLDDTKANPKCLVRISKGSLIADFAVTLPPAIAAEFPNHEALLRTTAQLGQEALEMRVDEWSLDNGATTLGSPEINHKSLDSITAQKELLARSDRSTGSFVTSADMNLIKNLMLLFLICTGCAVASFSTLAIFHKYKMDQKRREEAEIEAVARGDIHTTRTQSVASSIVNNHSNNPSDDTTSSLEHLTHKNNQDAIKEREEKDIMTANLLDASDEGEDELTTNGTIIQKDSSSGVQPSSLSNQNDQGHKVDYLSGRILPTRDATARAQPQATNLGNLKHDDSQKKFLL